MWEILRRIVTIVIGLWLIVSELLDQRSQILVIILGLVLVGIFTLPESFAFLKSIFHRSDQQEGGE